MVKKYIILLVLGFFVFSATLITGCGDGKNIKTRLGKEFTLSLESNPTTGYRWALAMPLDDNLLELVGSEYKADETELVGSGGKEFWTFKAIGKGETTIKLKYARPWVKDAQPAGEESFKVVIR